MLRSVVTTNCCAAWTGELEAGEEPWDDGGVVRFLECDGRLLMVIRRGTLSDGATIESPTASDTRFRLGLCWSEDDFIADMSFPSTEDPDEEVRCDNCK